MWYNKKCSQALSGYFLVNCLGSPELKTNKTTLSLKLKVREHFQQIFSFFLWFQRGSFRGGSWKLKSSLSLLDLWRLATGTKPRGISFFFLGSITGPWPFWHWDWNWGKWSVMSWRRYMDQVLGLGSWVLGTWETFFCFCFCNFCFLERRDWVN